MLEAKLRTYFGTGPFTMKQHLPISALMCILDTTLMAFTVERLPKNPIIYPELDKSIGNNINGPSLIRIPDWVENPLGQYYLYFAHHQGQHIRLAYANDLEGPWSIYRPGVLHVNQTNCRHHVASPDVHIEDGQIKMYFHGVRKLKGEALNFRGQRSFVAVSKDGLNFEANPTELGPFYFRVFKFDGCYYAIAKSIASEGGGVLLRSKTGLEPFEAGQTILPNMRHAAVLCIDNTLFVFYSKGHDKPEHILQTSLQLGSNWKQWQFTEGSSLLKPEFDYEGVELPIQSSSFGAIHKAVHELRDPAIFVEKSEVFLLYSISGESGIAIAKISNL